MTSKKFAFNSFQFLISLNNFSFMVVNASHKIIILYLLKICSVAIITENFIRIKIMLSFLKYVFSVYN